MVLQLLRVGELLLAGVNIADDALLVLGEVDRQVLLQLKPQREPFAADVAGEPETLLGRVNHLPVPPVRGLVEVAVTGVTILVLYPLVPGYVLLVARLAREVLLAERAAPGRAGAEVVARHVHSERFLRLEELAASVALDVGRQRQPRLAQQAVRLVHRLPVELLPAERAPVELTGERARLRGLGGRVGEQVAKEDVEVGGQVLARPASELLLRVFIYTFPIINKINKSRHCRF